MATQNMPTGGSPDNPVDPTLVQFKQLLAASAAALEAYSNHDTEANAEAARKAGRAVRDCRPTDPGVMAAWLRRLLDNDLVDHEDAPGLAHIADLLDDHRLLSPRAVAQIHAALVEAIEHHGGSIEREEEPGLPDSIHAFEGQMRAALALLEGRDAAPDRDPLWREIDGLDFGAIVDRIGYAHAMVDETLNSGDLNANASVDEWFRGLNRLHYLADRIGEHQRELKEAIARATTPAGSSSAGEAS